jgi:hypothetical protein
MNFCNSRKIVVRGGGLEPPQCCHRQDLNLVRLPISPPARVKVHINHALEHGREIGNPAF